MRLLTIYVKVSVHPFDDASCDTFTLYINRHSDFLEYGFPISTVTKVETLYISQYVRHLIS